MIIPRTFCPVSVNECVCSVSHSAVVVNMRPFLPPNVLVLIYNNQLCLSVRPSVPLGLMTLQLKVINKLNGTFNLQIILKSKSRSYVNISWSHIIRIRKRL